MTDNDMSDDFNLPPENVTTVQLFMLLQSINAKQSVMISEQARTNKRLEQLETDTADLRQAWKTAGSVLRLLRWAAAVGAGAAAIWAFVREILR